MTVLYTILAMVIGYSVIVLIHEWGHYITGRMFGVKTDEFSVGMGPKLLQKKTKNVMLSLRAIPIGGYVKFTGDEEVYGENTKGAENDPHIILNLSVWKKLIIYVAGAVMNFVLGFVLLLTVYFLLGAPTQIPTIGSVIEGTPADRAGLEANDRIVEIDGIAVPQDDYNKALELITEHISDKPVEIAVKRSDVIERITIQPEYEEETSSYKIGIYFGYTYGRITLKEAFEEACYATGEMITVLYRTLGNMIFKGEGLENLSGPIGIVNVVSDATRQGILSVVYIFAVISFNLAVINLLPFPALDGGKCFLLIIEAITKKPLPRKVEGYINLVGFAMLILLMLVITFKDVIHLF